jgi:hypothetical protein
MKKITILLILLFWFFIIFVIADNLEDVYRTGEIKLEADPEFGQNIDWEKIFYDYSQKAYGKSVGIQKSIAVAEDGSIFVSNYNNYSIYKFQKNGDFIKKFGAKGKKRGYFYRRPELYSIMDNRYVIVKAWHGGIYFFDLEGNFVKSHKFDFMPHDCIPLQGNKIVVSGFTSYHPNKIKNLVEIQDLDTGKRKQIAHCFRDAEQGTLSYKKEGFYFGLSHRLSGVNCFINRLKNGNIIVGFSNNSEISIFSPEGRKLKSFKLNITPIEIGEKEKQEFYESLKKSIQKNKLPETLLEQFKSKTDFFPKYAPLYYQLMVDSDGNILVFIYPSGKQKSQTPRVFQVYSPQGKYLCETLLNPGKYDIYLNPRRKSLAFFNGALYAIVSSKETDGIPLRLIKVNLIKY